uniref:Uncharacterized protein n=1 Tax=Chenopodium quinoa TaxID=63459 RepID=A0A803LWL5_CHEQI
MLRRGKETLKQKRRGKRENTTTVDAPPLFPPTPVSGQRCKTQKQYLWNADLDALVKKEYEKKAHRRLKEITYNVLVRNKSVPRWMGESMFEQIMAKRKDPAQKAGGVLLTAPEVFLKTHFKEVPGKGKVAANKRAQQISEAYQKKLDESSTQEGSQPDPNQLCWEVVGGRKKGVVKGLCASASLFYIPSYEKGSQSYNPSIASQLEERVQAEVVERIEEAKVQMQAQFATQLQEALKKEREEAAIESKRMMETMLQNLFSNCSGGPPFQFRREDDPDMSGGGLGH